MYNGIPSRNGLGFGDRQLGALAGVSSSLDTVGFSIDRIPPVEGTIALEGKVVPLCLVDGDMGDICRKGPDKLAERQSSDARKGSQEGDKSGSTEHGESGCEGEWNEKTVKELKVVKP